MIELKAPKNLLDLLELGICDIPNAQINVSLESPFVNEDSMLVYFFKLNEEVHTCSDKPAELGQLPKHIKISADSHSFPRCRDEFILDCLNMGYVFSNEDSIVIKATARMDGRCYEVLRASPNGVKVTAGPYEGWNLLSKEKIDKIRGICGG